MKKSLFAVVFLAAGVSLANAQSTEFAKKEKVDKTVKTELKVEEKAEVAAQAPTFKKEPLTVKKVEETAALKTETSAELKQEVPATKTEEKK